MKVSRLLAGALAVVMGVFPIAPPEHMHEAEEEGHVHVFVHRHLPAHGLLEHHPDHHPATVDHDDGPVLTLSSVYNIPSIFVVVAPLRTVTAHVEPPQPKRVERSSTDLDILIHGPPRASTALRGPPFNPTT